MTTSPLVTIVVPVFNDEQVIASALDSCLRQTLTEIEVVVIDDGSSDGTAEVVEAYVARDARVRLIRQGRNASAYQARRAGILDARADHLLFLDGDDELSESAAELALAKARASGADLVQFGIDVVQRDGATGGAFETRLQPRYESLTSTEVLRGLFPLDQPAQGQLWRYLFRTQLLRDAYALMPADLVLPRVNDLPITFLAAALATSFVSIPERLYRYHFGRGGSGQKVNDIDQAVFYAGAINSINTIAPAVHEIASRSADGESVRAAYESVRHAIIAYTTHYLAEHTREDLLDETFAHLYALAPAGEIVLATAKFWPRAIDALAAHAGCIELARRPVRSVLLTTNVLRTGGVSGVLLSQARLLLAAGFRVTIAAREAGSDKTAVPAGADFVEIDDTDVAAGLAQWADLCREHAIDVVIDHHWLYSRTWPAFALAARAAGAATIGWAHNFAGRAILVGRSDLAFHTRYLEALAQLVVLSPLDVAFWKLRGMSRVVYLPNPPSPLLLDSGALTTSRTAPEGRRIELVWWGRLEQRTKRVDELVGVAAELQRLGVDFRMRIIGPDWHDMTAERLNQLARERFVAERFEAVGPLHGKDLVAAIDASDLFVNTSAVEGYPLTIPEAQSRGLPVAMYEMPWLAVAEGNDGIVTAPQGDAVGLAERIAELFVDPTEYVRLSRGSIEAAERELSHDFATLYTQLLDDRLPGMHSPEPTIEDVQRLNDLIILFSEQNAESPADESAATRAGTREVGEETDSRTSAIVDRAAPAARAVLDLLPWLRPAAHRVKHTLLRR
ncbi:glycosyltransferase [Microbacterium sp. 2FI]|uniref:glycosyltransferase n=1 Tax=Microbacterium sp. 2FI TaxID=2502193 RepID=UPI0010F9B043|nr:glycosyltransferase [Microbacterium sp. 2FI]